MVVHLINIYYISRFAITYVDYLVGI
jgi:hypothetical protein